MDHVIALAKGGADDPSNYRALCASCHSSKPAKSARVLEPTGILSRLDGNALAGYCQLWARWKKAELFIQKNGDLYPIKDENGKIKCLQQFPQVAIAHKLAALLGRLEQEFGLTPSARSRITLPPGTAPVSYNPVLDGYLKPKLIG